MVTSIVQYRRSFRRDSNRDFAGYKSEMSLHESSSCVPVLLNYEICVIKKIDRI